MRLDLKIAFGALACLLFLGNCGPAQVRVNSQLNQSSSFPKTVAILPFVMEKPAEGDEEEAPNLIFREVFFNNFSYLGYTDMPLDEIDQRLANADVSPEQAFELRPRELKEILDVDAVIRGRILEAHNFTGGIHAETLIRAKLDMTDLNTGETLWEVEDTESTYSGIASPSVVGIIQEQMENVKVRRAYHKTAEMFSQNVIKQIPDPAVHRMDEVEAPVIASIETNIRPNQKLKPNDKIYVSLKGAPGMSATFDIGSWRTSIPMKETAPGRYTGSYVVKKGDQVSQAFIIGTLRNKQGLASKKYFKSALANIEKD